MPEIAIVTDSSACLPADLVERYGVRIVPLALLFGGTVFRDGELSRDEFYARLRDPEQRATTAAPAPGEFLEAFRSARAGGASSRFRSRYSPSEPTGRQSNSKASS